MQYLIKNILGCLVIAFCLQSFSAFAKQNIISKDQLQDKSKGAGLARQLVSFMGRL